MTTIIYILLIVVLAYNSIYTPAKEEEEGILVELADNSPKPKDLTQVPKDLLTKEERLNIAVNNAMKDQAKTDPYDYSDVEEADDAYKEKLVKEAISEQEYKKIFERDDINLDKNPKPKEDKVTSKQDHEKDLKKDKPSNFQGATYISYFLKNRYKMKIPIPTYRCETSGRVTVNITVNRNGDVISYNISEDSSIDECLRNSAIWSVKHSKFNQNFDAELRQKGSISYIFEAQ